MIFRLSQKLCTKIKEGSLQAIPLDENPFADWSAHLFVANRIHYILVSNTNSFYSVVLYGKGVTDDNDFLKSVLGGLRDFLVEDGLDFYFRRFIVPASGTARFAKPLNRSVTGSMNELIFHAKTCLIEGRFLPHEVTPKLNAIILSPLKYSNPKEAFKKMEIGQTRIPRDGS